VDVAGLRADAKQVYAALMEGGEAGIAGFDRRLFKPVIYQAD
jgi:hypothetical protein